MTQYGFIGTGSMGSMLITRLIGSELVRPADIHASSKTGVSARALAEKTGITADPDNRTVAVGSTILFICVKPLEVRGVLDEVRNFQKPGTLVISIAGCVGLKNLEEWGNGNSHYIRVIPSMTAEQDGGISLVAWGRHVTPEEKTLVTRLFNTLGSMVEVEERDFEVCTNLTSCGPALIAAMMKEFGDAAVRTGAIRPGLAEYLIRETMMGTARLLVNSKMTFDTVIERVATKGGSTEEGVRVIHAQLPEVMEGVHEALFEKRRLITEQVERKN